MIITPQFVLLNCPKTGSTFIRTVLREIDQRRQRSVFDRLLCNAKLKNRPFQELMLPNIRMPARGHIHDQHGTYEQIPAPYRSRLILTAVRNPFDRYVSKYKFQWWADHPIDDLSVVRQAFPNFPDLSFGEFLDYLDFEAHQYRIPGINPTVHLGHQTINFIQMYFRTPKKTLAEVDEAFIASRAYKDELPDMHILRTESLNQDLYDFLHREGYPKEEIAFILDSEKIQPPKGTSRNTSQDWRDYYTPELIQRTYQRERLLLHIYEDLGVGEPESWPMKAEVWDSRKQNVTA